MREVIKILRQLGRECIAELIGTLILCGFGNASIAVFILAPQRMSSSLSIHFSWGLGKQLFKQLVRPNEDTNAHQKDPAVRRRESQKDSEKKNLKKNLFSLRDRSAAPGGN